MELTKKTTILFSPDLHARLSSLAALSGTSLGDLVRKACEREYGLASQDDRKAAVKSLSSLNLPVGTVEEMVGESSGSFCRLRRRW